jgi:hypothetical protein
MKRDDEKLDNEDKSKTHRKRLESDNREAFYDFKGGEMNFSNSLHFDIYTTQEVLQIKDL